MVLQDKFITLLDAGLVRYQEALELQMELRTARIAEKISDTIIFCEHPPVFTIGKQDSSGDFISSMHEIEKDGIEVVRCERGGRITYHGPGQLVVYFIVKIGNFSAGVREFVALIEEVSIHLLRSFGLVPRRDEKYPGVWIGENKIVAVGLNISHGVTMHGMAINVAPELSHYRHIIPCGIKSGGITSISREMGDCAPDMSKVKNMVAKSIEVIMGCNVRLELVENRAIPL